MCDNVVQKSPWPTRLAHAPTTKRRAVVSAYSHVASVRGCRGAFRSKAKARQHNIGPRRACTHAHAGVPVHMSCAARTASPAFRIIVNQCMHVKCHARYTDTCRGIYRGPMRLLHVMSCTILLYVGTSSSPIQRQRVRSKKGGGGGRGKGKSKGLWPGMAWPGLAWHTHTAG